jgi:hypothetical protein
LGGLTIALFAVGLCACSSSVSPLEDSPAVPAERDACIKEFTPLRQEAEERGKLIKAASARHASADEACQLIGNFVQSEIRMIRYVEANSVKCAIPSETVDQIRAGYENTEAMQKKICAVAQRTQTRGSAGPVGDVDHIGAPPPVR